MSLKVNFFPSVLVWKLIKPVILIFDDIQKCFSYNHAHTGNPNGLNHDSCLKTNK